MMQLEDEHSSADAQPQAPLPQRSLSHTASATGHQVQLTAIRGWRFNEPAEDVEWLMTWSSADGNLVTSSWQILYSLNHGQQWSELQKFLMPRLTRLRAWCQRGEGPDAMGLPGRMYEPTPHAFKPWRRDYVCDWRYSRTSTQLLFLVRRFCPSSHTLVCEEWCEVVPGDLSIWLLVKDYLLQVLLLEQATLAPGAGPAAAAATTAAAPSSCSPAASSVPGTPPPAVAVAAEWASSGAPAAPTPCPWCGSAEPAAPLSPAATCSLQPALSPGWQQPGAAPSTAPGAPPGWWPAAAGPGPPYLLGDSNSPWGCPGQGDPWAAGSGLAPAAPLAAYLPGGLLCPPPAGPTAQALLPELAASHAALVAAAAAAAAAILAGYGGLLCPPPRQVAASSSRQATATQLVLPHSEPPEVATSLTAGPAAAAGGGGGDGGGGGGGGGALLEPSAGSLGGRSGEGGAGDPAVEAWRSPWATAAEWQPGDQVDMEP